jgi:hypothetical protein
MRPPSEGGFRERRQHARVGLRLPVKLFRKSGARSVTEKLTTRNFSVGGFYGVCIESFERDEALDCIVEISRDLQSFQSGLNLECNVHVVRVERILLESREQYGVAFQIMNYRVADAPA